ncbi:MAG: hypothetical protein IJX78_02080 [Bacilli bacterium]|nr:hypothetical protein [Bacilli bacterium]
MKITKDILLQVFCLLCLLGLVIYSILVKDVARLIVASIILLFYVGMIVLSIWLDIYADKFLKKKQARYKSVLEKTSKTIYDELYILAYQKQADDLLKELIKKEKVKGISSLDIEIIGLDKIHLYYKYNSFDVEAYIKDDCVVYVIDSPAKYDGTKANKELEKKRTSSFKINNYISVEDFFDEFIEVIKTTNKEIDIYIENNVVDNIFNGRLIFKLKDSTDYLKREGYICAILGIFLFIASVAILYSGLQDKEFMSNNQLGYFVCIFCALLFVGFTAGCTIYGFNYVIKYLNMKKDIEHKQYEIMTEKPRRVRIIHDQKSKYSNHRTLRYIKLYYQKTSLLIPFSDYEEVNRIKNKRKCCKELLKLHKELKYLKRSRLVISGHQEYIKIVKNMLE